MSRRGNCYDHAHTESFWSRLKAELLDDAELCYSALGYQSPNHFEIHLQTTSRLWPA